MPARDLHSHIRSRLDSLTYSLASEIETLIEERAVQLVAERLGVGLNGLSKRRPAKRTGRPVTSRARRGGDASARIVAYVKAHPGATSEAVRAALNITRSTWSYNITKALASKQIKRRGVKRASTLHPA